MQFRYSKNLSSDIKAIFLSFLQNSKRPIWFSSMNIIINNIYELNLRFDDRFLMILLLT